MFRALVLLFFLPALLHASTSLQDVWNGAEVPALREADAAQMMDQIADRIYGTLDEIQPVTFESYRRAPIQKYFLDETTLQKVVTLAWIAEQYAERAVPNDAVESKKLAAQAADVKVTRGTQVAIFVATMMVGLPMGHYGAPLVVSAIVGAVIQATHLYERSRVIRDFKRLGRIDILTHFSEALEKRLGETARGYYSHIGPNTRGHLRQMCEEYLGAKPESRVRVENTTPTAEFEALPASEPESAQRYFEPLPVPR